VASIFTKIINGEIPALKVAEDSKFLAFLDINPLAKGHTLVIPKIEVDYIFDLENEEFLGLHAFSKRVAIALEKSVKCKRVGVIVIGTEVPHAHIHLVPFQKEEQMSFSSNRPRISKEEMNTIAIQISENFI